MNAVANMPHPGLGHTARYAQIVRLSKKAEWQIDRDLIQGRNFDFSRKFLPDGLSRIHRLAFLSADEARLPQSNPGSHLRLYLWSGRTLHQRQDARSRSGACIRRSARTRSVGALF